MPGLSPGAFYPIFFNSEGELAEVGDALPLGQSADSVTPPDGLIAVWPTPRPDGEDGRWSVVPDTLRELIERGAVTVEYGKQRLTEPVPAGVVHEPGVRPHSPRPRVRV